MISPFKPLFIRDFPISSHDIPTILAISCTEFPWISKRCPSRSEPCPYPSGSSVTVNQDFTDNHWVWEILWKFLALRESVNLWKFNGHSIEILRHSGKLSKLSKLCVNRSFLSHERVLRTLGGVDSIWFNAFGTMWGLLCRSCRSLYVGCLSPKRPPPFSRGWWMTANVLVGRL